eukprot:TRINITY_DN38866_c0_g1_i1.p1 TRINITY_DN38866_c0_g1~~TRINITY_DN38866_c0_g1_i1.p1  ORF type:complete len:201 (+),score=34.57 TRINITY_DN38866_c0_g1_i1:36-638(+)
MSLYRIVLCFFFFKQKTAYEMLRSLVGSEMCIRDRYQRRVRGRGRGRFSVNDICKSIVVTAGIAEERDVQIGTTKVFLSSLARQVMEDKRAHCLNQFVMTVQGCLYYAGSVKQKVILELTKAALICQRIVRLKLRMRKVVKEFYVGIHRRIHQKLSDERHTFYLNETRVRTLIVTKEADRRREGNARFLRILLPLSLIHI